MGCRERSRGNIRIPGTRPAGVYTAGLAQRLVNIEGYIPGRDVVIIGSGDIGLIMARRMSWSGCKVHAVIEILPYPSEATRNIGAATISASRSTVAPRTYLRERQSRASR